MRKISSYLVTLVLANIFSIVAFAQNVTISGNVKNSVSGENAAAVSVTIKDSEVGTYTDDKGNFSITSKTLPVTLIITSVGYDPQEVVVSSASQKLNISFVPSNSLGQEVVVAASRVPEKILESPVSIERVNSAAIRQAPAASFYDVVATLKGVDVTTSSLTFKTPTTRGFGGSGNTRFNQLVDGMDNQAPGLNFSVGSIVGLNELDVDNLELLSGASSALYGPGGMNGTLLMTSKNPFKYQGLSFVVKQGILHTDGSERPTSPYYNWALRWGKKVSEKFAFKITTEFVHAKDWVGMDNRNYDRSNGVLIPGNRQTDPNYDGVNVYGDETSADINQVLNGVAAAAPFLKPFIDSLVRTPHPVSRTGYTEQELLNPNTINYKIGGSLHYKITPGTEAILAGYWGTGNTVYTGASRYSIADFKMGQYRLELLNKNWMLRAYTTQENAGGSHNLAATTQLFNESWKASGGSNGWFAQYGQAFLNGKLNGMNDFDAHTAARKVADIGRPVLGSDRFINSYDSVKKLPVPLGGALLDRSDLYSVEGNYNLSRFTKSFAEVLIGANFRRYSLNSEGTLFADQPGDPITIDEFGAFIQASRDITSYLKISASGRYDKNENFEGRFTPRLTAVVKVAPNNNIRLSYQTAYRFPSTQQQWIDLDLNSYKLIGGNKYFVDKYNFDTNPVYERDAYQNGGNLVQWMYPRQKAESLTSFEGGYKGLLMGGRLLIDAYGYYGNYKDFTGRISVIQAKNGNPNDLDSAANVQIYSVPINYANKIKTYGFGLGFDYRLPRNFTAGLNFSSDNLNVPSGLTANFNSPKYKLNASIGNTGFGYQKRMGFNVNYRWQDEFYFEGDLANGTLPAVQTVDAQFSYKLPKSKSILKIGANNLLNQYYYNAVGNSYVGGLYYVSFGYNIY
ncbi:MAG TPA: TonB-dependent receptor [Ferruginibacter sp.]|nr:TonB-dependent receptor [Ferruginibacter sp.]HRE62952.1 TonB-dependent receptor [Ferruginibacter sp.]